MTRLRFISESNVDQTGFIPTVTWMKTNYDKFNRKFFQNSLPDSANVKFELSSTQDALGDASTDMKIRMSRYYNNMTETEAANVLLHEMIHIWQYTNQDPQYWNSNQKAHGAKFLEICRHINDDSNHVYNVTPVCDDPAGSRHDNSVGMAAARKRAIQHGCVIVIQQNNSPTSFQIMWMLTPDDGIDMLMNSAVTVKAENKTMFVYRVKSVSAALERLLPQKHTDFDASKNVNNIIYMDVPKEQAMSFKNDLELIADSDSV